MYRTDYRTSGSGMVTREPGADAPSVFEPAVEARVLVVLPGRPQATALVRWAEKLARFSSGCFFCTSLKQSPGEDDQASRFYALSAMRLGEELGGQWATHQTDPSWESLLAFIHLHGITHIVVGKPPDRPLSTFLASTLPEELLADDAGPQIVVVADAKDHQ